MKLVSEPLLMLLTAPFHYGKGTLSGFNHRESSGYVCHFTVHSCFMSSGNCPWWPVLGFGSKLLSLCPGLLCSGHSLEVFPYSLPFPQSYIIISLVPHYSTFSAKDKDKEGSSTIFFKKFIFISNTCICFTKLNSRLMVMAGI
ncbi:hypothetical protein HJG60_010552 [Phyllostomus discolor]|uniref:Uncharacterized protein n=1 Tax=Phyllostomus discolor TaxID=89673 RepID=A0A834ANC7_9CHIR|nr:hypothetical protein HJG60_010552 [Phyllostomus discolor]